MKKILFSSQPEADLMMISTLFLPCVLFGSLKAVTGLTIYDSGNYKIMNDVAKCSGNLSFNFLCNVFFDLLTYLFVCIDVPVGI